MEVVRRENPVGVGMHIDKPGQTVRPVASITVLLPAASFRLCGAADHRRDLPVPNGHSSGKRRSAGAVHNGSTLKQQV